MAVLLSAEDVAAIQAAVLEVARSGFGSVRIVIEKGRPRRLAKEFDEWLGREGPPQRAGNGELRGSAT